MILRGLAVLTAAAAILSVPGTLRAEGGPEASAEEKIEALKAEIQGLLLLRELALDDSTAREFLALATRARQLTAEHAARQKEVLPEFEKACREFREEDHANKGFTPELEARALLLERRLIDGHKRYCETVNALEEKASALLTPAQRETIARFPEASDLAGLLRRLQGKTPESRLPKALEVEFSRVRAIPAESWARDRDSVVDEWVRRHERLNRPDLSPEDRGALRGRLAALLEDVRKMSAEEFASAGPRLLERLRPPDGFAALREEEGRVHKEVYGGLGRIGKFLCAPCAVPLLEKRLGLNPGEGKPAAAKGKETPAGNGSGEKGK